MDIVARTIGPGSVGYRLDAEALVFGGTTLTATDVGVAAGLLQLGDSSGASALAASGVRWAVARCYEMIEEGVDRMKADASPLPLLAVGGGAFLVPDHVAGIGEVVRLEHGSVANAVGAAIAQVSGEVDRVFSGMSRDAALAAAERIARKRAVESGADPTTLELVDVEDLPLAYLPGDARRVRSRVVGEARAAAAIRIPEHSRHGAQ